MAKILIVDDSPTVRASLNAILTQLSHEVVEAEDGYDGLSKLKRNKDVAMVFADVHMPQMDGLTMIKEIVLNTSGKYGNIPCVVISTEDDKNIIDLARLSGVKAWCVKPFQTSVIEQILSRYLEV
ncbi:MAG: response regulator [Zetaproteobacteria bacterium]|nr:response regulator [Zetaproteobacteria bacterium]